MMYLGGGGGGTGVLERIILTWRLPGGTISKSKSPYFRSHYHCSVLPNLYVTDLHLCMWVCSFMEDKYFVGETNYYQSSFTPATTTFMFHDEVGLITSSLFRT
jgi:hypothetical protein